MTREAVIVSTARTPIGKAYRGAFNDTDAPTMGGHVIAAAVQRAGHRSCRGPRRGDGLRHAAGLFGPEHRPHSGRRSRASLKRIGHEHGPSVRLGHDGYSDRCQAGDR